MGRAKPFVHSGRLESIRLRNYNHKRATHTSIHLSLGTQKKWSCGKWRRVTGSTRRVSCGAKLFPKHSKGDIVNAEYCSALGLSLSPTIRNGTQRTEDIISILPQVKSGRASLASSYISEKVFFDLFVYVIFDCCDIRRIGNDDDDGGRLILISLYVALFVWAIRFLLSYEIRVETIETVENLAYNTTENSVFSVR